MRISFDLDETLFVNPSVIKTESKLCFPYSLIYKEFLRLGAPALMNKIKDSGIELWIYTTSFRSISYIKRYFKHYGVRIDCVVNGDVHQKEIQKGHTVALPSKMPGKFRIDLHVDDDISVKQNASIYGFKVYMLNKENSLWTQELWDIIVKELKHST